MKRAILALTMSLMVMTLCAGELINSSLMDCELINNSGITVSQENGFSILSATIKPETIKLGRIEPYQFKLNVNDSIKWVTFGTDGLKAQQHSHTFAAIADPETNQALIIGWLTQRSGSGTVKIENENNILTLQAFLDYGNKEVTVGENFQTEKLVIGWFSDVRVGLESYADLMAKEYQIKLKPQPELYCTWYHTWGASSPKKIQQNTDFAKEYLVPWGFDVIQLDDKWQAGDPKGNGPAKNFTTVSKRGKYRKGMKATADYIQDAGMTAGLWFMPFAGTFNDPWFADKQHYFVKRQNGKPLDTAWGGTCLDMTHPEAQSYLANIVDRISNQWGYKYFKIDGLWTGTATDQIYVNKGYRNDHIEDAVFHNPSMSNIEAYRKGLTIVNEASQHEAFVLGCNLAQNMRVLGGSIGLVDGMRVGADNNANWDEMKVGPWSINSLYFLNKKVWYNDPDPMYIRKQVPYHQAQTLATFVAFTGSLHTTSIQYKKLPQDRIELLQKTIPTHNQIARPEDMLISEISKVWTISRKADKAKGQSEMNLVGFFNWEDSKMTEPFAVSAFNISSDKAIKAFSFWDEKEVSVVDGKIDINLNKAECQIISIKEQTTTPQIIATNRHIGCGLVEVKSETATSSILTASIDIPPMADFKLFVIPAKGEKFTKESVSATMSEGACCAKVTSVEVTDQLITVHINSSKLIQAGIIVTVK